MTPRWFEATAIWWRCAVSFPRSRRRVFYQLAAAQLRGGVAPSAAFAAMAAELSLDRASGAAARRVAAAVGEGRGVWEGLVRTRSVPADEVGVVRVAEGAGDLAGGFEELAAEASGRLGILRSVLGPNTYYLAALGVGVFGVTHLGDLMEAGSPDPAALAANGAYRLSRALSAWAPAGAVFVAAGAATVVAGRRFWRGRARLALGFFDAEHRARIALRFAEMAARLYRRGASHGAVLRAYEEAYAGSGFTAWAARSARRDLDAGMEVEAALRGRLVTPGIAEIVTVMVPGGDPALYAGAWAEVAEIQRTLLSARYAAAANAVRIGALALIGGMIAVVVPGMYAAYTVV